MVYSIDETHRPDLPCWVASANDPSSSFPIQNLPFCIFRDPKKNSPRCGIGIGDEILDLRQCADANLFDGKIQSAVSRADLRDVMALSLIDRIKLRKILSRELSNMGSPLNSFELRQKALVSQKDVELLLPCSIGDYSDFYASIYHATNVGSMFRPENPLLPNYKHIPIGYHGRASSLVPSGTPIIRPNGQLPPPEGDSNPTFGPSKNLDYELEIGAFVGLGNRLGTTINIGEAESHLFGLCILNDWSARDIQRWEYQPLGPFLAKSFASTISPWIVSMEALAPFRSPAFSRASDDPKPLNYLLDEENQRHGGFDITLEVRLSSQAMRDQKMSPVHLSTGTFEDMYWTIAQMLTHHASNGCNLCTGDLLGSGTVSGKQRQSRGCLLELTWDGEIGHPVAGTQRTPIELPTGEKRIFLADGDLVSIRATCERSGFRSIGFGVCEGTIVGQSV